MGRITRVNGYHLKYAFLAGTRCLESNMNYINRINVFPVPDGDTGTNMVATLRYINSHTLYSRSFYRSLDSIAEASLIGARGNSGLILAQYLFGLSRVFHGYDRVTAKTFGKGVMEAFPFSQQALSTPQEGTILTVIREWGEAVNQSSIVSVDFQELLSHSFEKAIQSLYRTKNMLKPLKESGVVDAGALGFINFIQGILESGQDLVMRYDQGDMEALFSLNKGPLRNDNESSFRYCTEMIIEGKMKIQIEKIRENLSKMGDSLVISGAENICRVHIHTNDPSDVAAKLKKWGNLTHQKVDDMYLQQRIARRGKSGNKVALLTDSSCDLPRDILDKYGIHVISMKLAFGRDEYVDKLTIRPEQVYSVMSSSDFLPVTSMPSQGEFRDIYVRLLKNYDSVIAIHLSDKLSGTYNASYQAALNLGILERVSIINSKNLCVSLGLIVLDAAEALEKGYDHTEVVNRVNVSIDNAFIYVSLNTLKYMIRGGRINPLKGRLAGILNLKPVISLDREGKGIHYGQACGKMANTRRIIDLFIRHWESGGSLRYAVVHAGAEKEANKLAHQLCVITGRETEYIAEISPVIGINSGPGSLAVGGICK